jgi:hypothetical protein
MIEVTMHAMHSAVCPATAATTFRDRGRARAHHYNSNN